MSKKTTFAFLALLLLLSACGPSAEDQNAALATQVQLLLDQQAATQAAAAQATLPPTDAPAAQGDSNLPPDAACIPAATERVEGVVEDVWSGDSFQVSYAGGSFEVRLIGIDAGESAEALEALRQLVQGKTVLLIREVTDVDQYGRLPRYVIVDGIFVNLELVRRGLASPSPEEPDLACRIEFRDAAPQ